MRSFAMKAAVVGIAALWLAGCETGPDVRADYDKAADFGKYRTYNFVAATGTGSTDAKSLAQQILQNAASREMESRGYTKADNADLLINFKGKLEEKTDIESTPAPMYGAGWGYRGYYGAPYGAYGYGGTEVSTRRYNVGTLVMDMVDRAEAAGRVPGRRRGRRDEKDARGSRGAVDRRRVHHLRAVPVPRGPVGPRAHARRPVGPQQEGTFAGMSPLRGARVEPGILCR